MADLGAIARPNGRDVSTLHSIRASLLWQNGTPYAWAGVVYPNPSTDFYAIKSANLWQNAGTFNYLTTLRPNGFPAHAHYFIPWYKFLYTPTLAAQSAFDCNGSIYGKVTITGIRQPNAEVRLLEGNEMTVIGLKYTNALGEYRFDGLPLSFTNFTILVDDPTGQYNQGRLDNMTPV